MDGLPAAVPSYEAGKDTKEDVTAEVRASFEHLRAAIESTVSSGVEQPVAIFGDTVTLRAFWNGQLGHLHEHLGQWIATARMNGVVPP